MDSFAAARGTFVWVVSDDDVVEPLAIQTIVETLEKHETIGGLYIQYSEWSRDLSSRVTDPLLQLPHHFGLENSRELLVNTFHLGFISCMVFRRGLALTAPNIQSLVGTHWINVGMMLYCVAKSGGSFVPTPMVKQRLENSLHFGYYKTFVFSWAKVAKYSRTIGYSKTFEHQMRVFAIKIKQLSARHLLADRLDDPQITCSIHFKLMKELYWCPSYWYRVFPAAIIPLPIARRLRAMFGSGLRTPDVQYNLSGN